MQEIIVYQHQVGCLLYIVDGEIEYHQFDELPIEDELDITGIENGSVQPTLDQTLSRQQKVAVNTEVVLDHVTELNMNRTIARYFNF